MAIGDLNVIVYKILSYLRKCGTDGTQIDKDFFSSDNLQTNERQLHTALYEAYKNGLIDGVREVEIMNCPYKQMRIMDSIHLTLKGEEFLKDNSTMNKVKEFLKDIRQIV